MRKVKIKGLPNKAHGGPTGGAADGVRKFMDQGRQFDSGLNQFAAPDFEVNKTMSGVDPNEANIEAEGGEVAVVPGQSGIPEAYKITGPRHGGGGVPLNLAPDSFIFSDHKKGNMKLKDKEMLAEFGISVPKKGKSKGHTFAKIAGKYDINEYKKLLLNPDSDSLERETAELMIANYNMKLGKLALVQEAKKGFPQEIPAIAQPYLASIQQDPNQFGSQPEQGQPMQAAYGAGVTGDPSQYSYMNGGENNRMKARFPGLDIAQRGGEFEGAFWKSIMQEGGDVNENLFNYLSGYGFADDVNIPFKTPSGKDKPIPMGNTNPFQYTPDVKGKNMDRIMLQGQSQKADSVYTQEGFPANTGVAWINGKPVVVPTKKGSTEAQDFTDAYGNFRTKGKSNPTIYPMYSRPKQADSPSGYQNGGDVNDLDSYVTQDQVQTPVQGEGSNYVNETKAAPITMTEGERIMTFGSKQEQSRWLNDQMADAEAAGLDPAKYVGEELAMFEMTPEQIIEWEKDFSGFPIKSIVRHMAKEESKANRNSHPMQIVDLSTGEIITDNASPAEVQAVNKVQEKTVGANVKTGKPVYNLPEGATIHEYGEEYDKTKTKKGDYVRYADGTIKQITNNKLKYKTSASGPENYVPTYGSIEEDVEKAKEIISKHSDVFTKGTSGKNKGKWMTDGEAKNALTLAEKDLLTQVSQYSGEKGNLGALDLHFGTQSSSKDSPFYGFVDGELLEYKYWQASNPDKTAEDYEALDNTDKVTNRKEFLDIIGMDSEKLDPSRLVTPGDLYTEEFLKGDNGFTKKLETAFGKDSKFRESHGNDFKIGMDHVDNFKLDVEQELADVAQAEQKKENKIAAAEDPNYKQPSTDAPWWAQDVGNMLMTVGERASVKKYLPNSTPINYAKPDVLYYDPSRALAANAEQTNIAAQQIGAFAGSQGTYQLSGLHGQGTQNAANILADYEAKNVGIGNQYLDKVQQATTQENIANARRMDNLFDQTTIANQQFDNSKTALNRNVFEAWKNGLTNATKTQTMNSLYPQFNVNPWDGGTTAFTEGRDLQENTPPGSSSNDISKGYKQFIKDTGLPNEGRSYSAYAQQQGLPSGTRRNQRQQQREDFLNSYGRR